jgi:3-dehydroquinate dehydratase-2
MTLSEIESLVKREFPKDKIEFFQSNHEGKIVDEIQKSPDYFDAIIINPGGYAHTSVAIRDALELLKLPKIEVHLSNLSKREDFRNIAITAQACDGVISGFKEEGYLAAIYLIKRI